jgi:uncharacterized protein (TIGR00297 family)
MGRVLAGLGAAGVLAGVSWRIGALSRTGALAATLVGTICIAAGWSWGVLLVAFFVPSSGLSRLGADRKASRTAGIIVKGGARDARQVLANGGVFACAAGLHLAFPWQGWMSLGAGSLAAAAADTWGTEVGTLSGAQPRSITSWRPVSPGTSGGVSVTGSLASVAGALFMALATWLLRWPEAIAFGAFIGGIAGATLDSLLGALVQARRRCDICGVDTERAIHSCGSPTRLAGGVSWLDNDGVNLISVAAGGVIALVASV